MSSLKDALTKAGLKPSKKENDRERRGRWVDVKKSVIHQEQRNYCEVCESVQPDVERYKHRNPIINAQWICVSCADKNLIDDKFRVTAQSDFSKRSIFKREFGQTNKDVSFRKPGSNAKVNGNKFPSNKKKYEEQYLDEENPTHRKSKFNRSRTGGTKFNKNRR